MSKVNTKTKKDQSNVDLLKQNISSKLNFESGIVRTNNVYGVLLSNNEFVVAKEVISNGNYSAVCLLEDFFTEKLIKHKAIVHRENDKNIPWHSEDVFCTDDGLKAIAFPIREILDKHISYGITTKKNILATFQAANAYLREEPTFVYDTFKEMESSKHI